MTDAIREALPAAIGILISPLPVVAVILMLLSGRARANAVTFVVTWFVAVVVTATVVAFAAQSWADGDNGGSSTGWVQIGLGALVLLVALRQWRGRPRSGGEPAAPPRWMAALDAFTPVRAAGLAVLLAVVNPKNLVLCISGGAEIATAADGDTTAAVAALVVFALVATVGVAAPVVVYLATGDRAQEILDRMKAWMIQHNAVVMAVLLLVIGLKLVVDGITAL